MTMLLIFYTKFDKLKCITNVHCVIKKIKYLHFLVVVLSKIWENLAQYLMF